MNIRRHLKTFVTLAKEVSVEFKDSVLYSLAARTSNPIPGSDDTKPINVSIIIEGIYNYYLRKKRINEMEEVDEVATRKLFDRIVNNSLVILNAWLWYCENYLEDENTKQPFPIKTVVSVFIKEDKNYGLFLNACDKGEEKKYLFHNDGVISSNEELLE